MAIPKLELLNRIAVLEGESGVSQKNNPIFQQLTSYQWLFVLLYTREVPLQLEEWCEQNGFSGATVTNWLKNDKVVSAINSAYMPVLKRKAFEGLDKLYEIFQKTGNIRALDLFLKHMSLDKARLSDQGTFQVSWDLSGQRWETKGTVDLDPSEISAGGNKTPTSVPTESIEDKDSTLPDSPATRDR